MSFNPCRYTWCRGGAPASVIVSPWLAHVRTVSLNPITQSNISMETQSAPRRERKTSCDRELTKPARAQDTQPLELCPIDTDLLIDLSDAPCDSCGAGNLVNVLLVQEVAE